MSARAAGADADSARPPTTPDADRVDARRLADVRLRRGPRRGRRDRNRRDAGADGTRARARPARRISLRERRGRPARDPDREQRQGRARRARPRRDQNGLTVAYEFKLPDLGEGLTEGEIARWLVSEGQEIAEDDPLVEIQTDKTTVEIPSPAAGVVTSILVEEGKVVPVGTVLVVIGGDADGERRRVATETAQSERAAKGRATPLVRKIAQELGVDLDALTGTGPQGRITEEDVRASAGPGEGRREPLRGVRRVVAEHMARAHREVPAVTWVEECDFTHVELKLLVPTLLKACAVALQEFPELNARFDGDAIVYLERFDLGIAVQTEQGLVVPVV